MCFCWRITCCVPAIEPYLFVCLFVCIVKHAFWFVSSWSSSLMLFPHAGAQEFAVHGLVYKGGKYNAHRERRRGASYAVFCIASTNPCASSSTPAWVSPSPLCSLKRVLVCWPSCHGMFPLVFGSRDIHESHVVCLCVIPFSWLFDS